MYYYFSLKSSPILKFERAFEVIKKTKEIIRKHLGDIGLGSPKERQVLVNKLIQFPF
jgi:hypothetical protein